MPACLAACVSERVSAILLRRRASVWSKIISRLPSSNQSRKAGLNSRRGFFDVELGTLAPTNGRALNRYANVSLIAALSACCENQERFEGVIGKLIFALCKIVHNAMADHIDGVSRVVAMGAILLIVAS